MACNTELCEQWLPELQAAYYGFLTGKRQTSFKYRERTITYQSVSDTVLKEMKAEIMRLETACGCADNGRKKPLRLGVRRGC